MILAGASKDWLIPPYLIMMLWLVLTGYTVLDPGPVFSGVFVNGDLWIF